MWYNDATMKGGSMSHRTRIAAAAVLLLLAALPTAAQNVTVETDQDVYHVGDLVEITVSNLGPADAQFLSAPYIAIIHLETDDCIYGCVGLPVITPFPAGAVHVESWDTGQFPDRPGTYRVSAAVAMAGLGRDVTSAVYTLVDPTPNAALTWSGVKTLYR